MAAEDVAAAGGTSSGGIGRCRGSPTAFCVAGGEESCGGVAGRDLNCDVLGDSAICC
jgi:hypothetical protein